jgi:hypothetical protein
VAAELVCLFRLLILFINGWLYTAQRHLKLAGYDLLVADSQYRTSDLFGSHVLQKLLRATLTVNQKHGLLFLAAVNHKGAVRFVGLGLFLW